MNDVSPFDEVTWTVEGGQVVPSTGGAVTDAQFLSNLADVFYRAVPPGHRRITKAAAARLGRIAKSPRFARRFSMDVAEDALAQMGAEAIPHIALELAKRVVFEHGDKITRTVDSYLNDRAWGRADHPPSD